MKFIKTFLKKYPAILYAAWLPLYIGLFLLVQQIITPESGYVAAYLPIDDLIPFRPWFIVFYFLWFPFMAITGFYLLFTDGQALKRNMVCLGWGFFAVLALYFIIPSGQDLYPAAYGQDFFSRLVQWVHGFDSNVNVFPSGHVMGAVVTQFAIFDSARLRKWWILVPTTLLATLICVSTVFVKQHSVIDLIASALLCLGLYLAVYSSGKLKIES